MSSKEGKPKSSKPSKKSEKTLKQIHTSAEYIIDSDLEADGETIQQGSSKESGKKSKNNDNGSPTRAKKRKTLDEVDSNLSKKRKKNNETEDRRGEPSQKMIHSSSMESKTNGIPKPDARDTPDTPKAISTTKSRINGSSRSNPSDSSERDSDTDSDSQPHAPKPDHFSDTPVTTPAASKKVSHSGVLNLMQSDDSEETDEDVVTDSSSVADVADTDEEQVAVVPPSAMDVVTFPPYRPPEGFSTALLNSDLTKGIRSLLSTDSLQGKQVWHITAPTSLPISHIKRITRNDINSGKSVLSYKGSNYGFHVDSANNSAASKILVPTRNSHKYASLPTAIEQTLHLRQVIDLPGADSQPSTSTSNSATIAGARKPVLKQPVGLKLKYQPIGVAGIDQDEYVAAKQAKQRIDNTRIPLPAIAPKHKSHKKTEKSRKVPKHSEKTQWVDPQAYSAPVVVGSASQQTVDIPRAALEESQLGPDEGVSLEQKAKHKAEKAARKQERRKKREAKAAVVAEV